MLFIYKEIREGEGPEIQVEKSESISNLAHDTKNIINESRSHINQLKSVDWKYYFNIDIHLNAKEREKALFSIAGDKFKLSRLFFQGIKLISHEDFAEELISLAAQTNPSMAIEHINNFVDLPYAEKIIKNLAKKAPGILIEFCYNFISKPYAEDVIRKAAKQDPTMALIFSYQYKDQPYFDQIIKTILPDVDISYMTNFLEMAHASGNEEYSFDYYGTSIQLIYNNADNYLIRAKIDQIYEKYYGKNPDYNTQFSKQFPKLNEPVNKNKTIHFDEELKEYSTPIQKKVRRKFLEKRINIPITNQYGITYDQNGIPIGTFDYDLDTINHSVKNNVNKSIKEKLDHQLIGIKIDENRQKNLVRDYVAMIELPMRANLEENFGIKLENFNLRIQIQFLNFLKNKTENEVRNIQKFLNESSSETERHHRLKAFLALESDPSMGDVILKLGKRRDADKIFARFAELMEVFEKQEEVLREQLQNYEEKKADIDTNRLYLAITRRGNELLKRFAADADQNKNNLKLEDIDAYKADVIAWGALFSATAKSKDKLRSPKEINKIIKGVKVEIKPGGNLIKATDRESMRNPDNYTNPGIFNEKDYEMLVRNLKKSYQEIDPGWLEHLIDNIPKDLQNPKVKFTLIRNTKNGKLVGLCKIKKDPEEENTYYFGTHYVEPEFQRTFGLGGYLQKMAESQIPEDAKIVATVAAANPAMERHIDTHNGIGTDIVFEADEKNTSKELVKFAWRDPRQFKTKDQTKFSREKITGMANGKHLKELPENTNIYLLDTHDGHNQEFLDLCQQHFAEGKVITRIFYDKTPQDKPNLEKTYVVFEKSKEAVHQNPQNLEPAMKQAT